MIESEIDYAALMQEGPNGENHGRVATPTGQVTLSSEQAIRAEFMSDGGFGIADTERSAGGAHGMYGAADAGMRGSRGPLAADEYVQLGDVRNAIADLIGEPLPVIMAVYARQGNGGPTPKNMREVRDRLDGRMLALSRSATNMDLLARMLTIPSSTLKHAIGRAQRKEATS